MMFELTNLQRKCFGLTAVESNWIPMELKPAPYDSHVTLAYRDGNVLRKYIESGSDIYREYEIYEQLSDDFRYILPKTAKGKPALLSAATLKKRSPLGMCLYCLKGTDGYSHIDVFCHSNLKSYYSNDYEYIRFDESYDFPQWVEDWCAETTEEDLADIAEFSAQPRQHVKFREGDVFRFKIDRRSYGYGRILLDYAMMRKKKESFWDILPAKPLACSVYHTVTLRKDMSLEELARLDSLPSLHMMDNYLFYGQYEIIGNIPISENEDYPIMYGNSITAYDRAVCLQCGKLFLRHNDERAIFQGFTHSSIGFPLNFRLPVLLECIAGKSNAPYWAQDNWKVNGDLRNPKFRSKLEQVCRQFNIAPSQLIHGK